MLRGVLRVASGCAVKVVLLACTVLAALSSDAVARKEAIVFDAGIHCQDVYQNSIDMLKARGWGVAYYSLEQALEHGLDALQARSPRLQVFVLNDEFLRAKASSVVGKFVQEALARSSRVAGGTTVVMLPMLGQSFLKVFAKLKPVAAALGLERLFADIEGDDDLPDEIRKPLRTFLTHSLAQRKINYHTALRVPDAFDVRLSKNARVFVRDDKQNVVMALPYAFPGRFEREESRMTALLPIGMGFYDAQRDHTFVFSHASLMGTLDVAEDIHSFPYGLGLQDYAAKVIDAFWGDLDIWMDSSKKRSYHELRERISSEPLCISSGFARSSKVKRGARKATKTAWMELVVFEEGPGDKNSELVRKRRQQRALVRSLLEAGIDAAWISLSPQMYYGVNAKSSEKRALFEAGFVRFAKMLKEESISLNVPIPKILVGFEIVNNLYDEHLPRESAIDLYGNEYRDVPSPCSKKFWDEEVARPLEKFCAFFAEQGLGNFVNLGGVVIDCELYGRVNTSTFSSLMFCDPMLARAFCKHLGRDVIPDDFGAWVVKEKKVSALRDFAALQVRSCATHLKHVVSACMPRGVIACYAPVVSLDWFLTSFCRGLGSADRPFPLFTFNTSIERIKLVVERRFGMPIAHSAVLMLSKFCSPQDYDFLDRAMKGNDGYWFNRWSRFVEPRDPGAWHAIEQPRIDSVQDCASFYAHVAQHGREKVAW